MKILIVTPYKGFKGGVESVNKILCGVFEGAGYDVDFLTTEGESDKENYFLKRVVGLPSVTAKKYKKIDRLAYDLVIANGEFSFGINHPNMICVFHGSYLGLRDHLRNNLTSRQYMSLSWHAIIQRFSARKKKVVAVSQFIKEILLRQGIRVSYVIPNCVDTEKFSPKYYQSRKKYLFVGSYHYYGKGFDILEKLASKGYIIDCVTNTPPKHPLGYVKSVSYDLMPDLYRNYRLLIFPSRFEAFGLAPLEAMACGLPVVMTNVGIGVDMSYELPEFVVNVHASNMATDIANKIEKIELDYDSYSRKAREYVVKYYSFSVFKYSWLNLVKDCCVC